MIKFIGDLPKRCVVAFSGGVDSVAVVDFLLNGKRDVTLAFFDHGTQASAEAEAFVVKFASERSLDLCRGRISNFRDKLPGESLEEYWRLARYDYLDAFSDAVITAHHLDDAVETWIFSSLHGTAKLIPYQRRNVIRPFLVTPKSEFIDWTSRRGLTWSFDTSNDDVRFMRNRIRRDIVPLALQVNPGLRSVIRKKYQDVFTNTRYNNDRDNIK